MEPREMLETFGMKAAFVVNKSRRTGVVKTNTPASVVHIPSQVILFAFCETRSEVFYEHHQHNTFGQFLCVLEYVRGFVRQVA